VREGFLQALQGILTELLIGEQRSNVRKVNFLGLSYRKWPVHVYC